MRGYNIIGVKRYKIDKKGKFNFINSIPPAICKLIYFSKRSRSAKGKKSSSVPAEASLLRYEPINSNIDNAHGTYSSLKV